MPLERINCSAATSLPQLLGGVVPQLRDGVRVFAWQDGKLLAALKRGAWVLLDEVNLLPPHVLDTLVPLLDRYWCL